MAEVEYTATTKLPVETIWDYVQEMDNWAHHMVGYQSHVKQSPVLSLWTLKGDVGVLTRTLTFEVHIEEWNGPERVRFRLRGVNESMTGEGVFRMESWQEADADAAPARRAGAWVRGIAALLRFLRRLFGGRAPRRAAAPAGPGVSRLVFRLELKPGGPMGPMVDAMIKPAMLIAAEELSNKIIAEAEARQAAA
jgi:carbon monoxide dehydrogenase subunit G